MIGFPVVPTNTTADINSAAGQGASMWPLLVAMSVGQGITSLIGNHSQKKAQEDANKIAREKIAADKAAQQQDTALAEAGRDPFRDQMNQARDVGRLDMMERANYSPVQPFNLPSRYASNAVAPMGGFSYTKSPDVGLTAGADKRSVMAGQGAPSMTNPANYGKTGALDVLRIIANNIDPASPDAFATGAPVRPGAANLPVNNPWWKNQPVFDDPTQPRPSSI